MSVTGIIAGQGDLPRLIADRLAAQGERFVLAEMEGFPAEVPGVTPVRFRVERLVPFLDHLAQEGVDRIVLAGAVRRPRLEAGLFDPRTAEIVPRLIRAIQSGDDAALREIIAIFEDWDFRVIGADAILPDLLPRAGVATRAAPARAHEADAAAGEAEIAEMGRTDTGQACVVAEGRVVAREGPEGTDAMLAALPRQPADGDGWSDPVTAALDLAGGAVAAAADWLTGDEAPACRGILFKAPKPGQERRADLPVIGPATARGAAAAGLAGIVIEAGGVMVIDLPRVTALLDAAGLFLWVRPRGSK